MNKDPTGVQNKNENSHLYYTSASTPYNSYRSRLTGARKRGIVTPIYNRIALDVAQLSIMHVQLDKEKRFKSEIDSELNKCLTLEANIDQTSDAFMQDVVLSLFDEGYVAIVPVETEIKNGSLDVCSMRTGKIVEWYPSSVKVNLYNELVGKNEDVVLPKSKVAIIENPFYAVMNEPNSTLQRLIHKLALIDVTDERVGSGKLDLFVSLPYITRTDHQRDTAKKRLDDITDQLTNSQYGIAYIDGSEKITQLNRAVDNQLLKQIENLTIQLFSHLGLTQGVLDGTADEQTMTHYYKRTVRPIVNAIVDELKRKFLTTTARMRSESIMAFINPLDFVTSKQLVEITNAFRRNEVCTSNDIRQSIGWKPSDDPRADDLHNSNMPYPDSGSGYANSNSQSSST